MIFFCAIWAFHREVEEKVALLGHYAASSGNFLPPFFFVFFILEDGTNRFTLNVSKKLPLLAA